MPVHPRTRNRLDRAGYRPPAGLRLMEPLGYLDFIALESEARLVVTDSGGVQEETSVLGVPCLTYRTTTERPITVSEGTNQLVGLDPDRLRRVCRSALRRAVPESAPNIPLWDGNAGSRVVKRSLPFFGTGAGLRLPSLRRSGGTR